MEALCERLAKIRLKYDFIENAVLDEIIRDVSARELENPLRLLEHFAANWPHKMVKPMESSRCGSSARIHSIRTEEYSWGRFKL